LRSLNIGLISVGPGNIMNLYRGIKKAAESEKIEFELKFIDNSTTEDFDILFLPGVGHFAEGMKRIRESGLHALILKHIEDGKVLVGICLGMQLLFDKSEEAPGTKGLKLINGEITKLNTRRLPHMGWNTVEFNGENFKELSGEFFYFVHSYRVRCKQNYILGFTEYEGELFPSVVKNGNILGFQFHPEKSHLAGQKLLGRLLKWSLSQL